MSFNVFFEEINELDNCELIESQWNDHGYYITYRFEYKKQYIGDIKVIMDDVTNYEKTYYVREFDGNVLFTIPSSIDFYKRLYERCDKNNEQYEDI